MYWNIPTIWSQIEEMANYADRAQAVQQFNAKNRWVKRGISLMPVKFPVGYAGAFVS